MRLRIELDVAKAFQRPLTAAEQAQIRVHVDNATARFEATRQPASFVVAMTRLPTEQEKLPVQFSRKYSITKPLPFLEPARITEAFFGLAPFLRSADSPAARMALSRSFDARLTRHLGHGRSALPKINCFYEMLSDQGEPPNLVAATKSMQEAGHAVRVWSYSPDKLKFLLPHGVELMNAEAILPASLFEEIVSRSHFTYFSNVFRYALLHECGGLWMDSDVVLLRPFPFQGDYFLNLQWRGAHVGHFICGNVMYAKPGSHHIRTLLEMSIDRFSQSESIRFGDIGPRLLSEYVISSAGSDLKDWIFSPVPFNSIDWTEVDKFDQSPSTLTDYLDDDRIFGLHLWNSRTNLRERDKNGSLFELLANSERFKRLRSAFMSPSKGAVGGIGPTRTDPAQLLLESYRSEQLGAFPTALEGYKRAAEMAPDLFVAAVRYCRLKRDLRSDRPHGLKIVWQVDPQGLWESDWVRFLLSGVSTSEIVDGRYTKIEDGCIVVDNRIGSQKARYYFELLKRNCRFGIFHLSDERFLDDCGVYEFANFVVRNYWSRTFSPDRRVLAVPLGLMNGFCVETQRTASERRYTWAFAGDARKSTRGAMVQAMSAVERGFFHGTAGEDSREDLAAIDLKPPLGIAGYAAILSDAVFAPCPAGWENLDSFRVCEAFEAGCIPIVETRPSYDYFHHLMPGYPGLAVRSWHEAPGLLRPLLANPAALETKRDECARWWRAYRTALSSRVRDHVRGSFEPLGARTSA